MQTYAQPVYEIFDKQLGNIYRPAWTFRNLAIRLIFRTAFISFCCFIGALVPFFGANPPISRMSSMQLSLRCPLPATLLACMLVFGKGIAASCNECWAHQHQAKRLNWFCTLGQSLWLSRTLGCFE